MVMTLVLILSLVAKSVAGYSEISRPGNEEHPFFHVYGRLADRTMRLDSFTTMHACFEVPMSIVPFLQMAIDY